MMGKTTIRKYRNDAGFTAWGVRYRGTGPVFVMMTQEGALKCALLDLKYGPGFSSLSPAPVTLTRLATGEEVDIFGKDR